MEEMYVAVAILPMCQLAIFVAKNIFVLICGELFMKVRGFMYVMVAAKNTSSIALSAEHS